LLAWLIVWLAAAAAAAATDDKEDSETADVEAADKVA
jgi:hypothetical protein